MSTADEETRAAAYRAQRVARKKNKRARERALRGDKAATRAVCDAWVPLLPYNRDGVPRVGVDLR